MVCDLYANMHDNDCCALIILRKLHQLDSVVLLNELNNIVIECLNVTLRIGIFLPTTDEFFPHYPKI